MDTTPDFNSTIKIIVESVRQNLKTWKSQKINVFVCTHSFWAQSYILLVYKHKPATNHQQFVYLSKYHRSDYSVWSECYATQVACIFSIVLPILQIQRNNLLLLLVMFLYYNKHLKTSINFFMWQRGWWMHKVLLQMIKL